MASASVTVSDHLQKHVQRMLRGVAPGTLEAIEREAERVKAEAAARWPVGKEQGRPHSRDLFRVSVRVTPDAVQVDLTNGADYLFFIKTAQLAGSGKKSPFVFLIRRPARKGVKALVRETAKGLKQLAGRS